MIAQKAMCDKGTYKYNLINKILRLNEQAIEKFGIEKLTKEELYKMNINYLKNVESELRVQLGIRPTGMYYKQVYRSL